MGSWARRRPLQDAAEEPPSAPAFEEAPKLSPGRAELYRHDEDSRSRRHLREPSSPPRLGRLSKPDTVEKPLHDVQYMSPFSVVYPPTQANFADPPANTSRSLLAPVQAFPGAVPPPAEVAYYRQQSAAGRQKSRKCTFVWVVPLIVIACITMFIITMYENNCPHQVRRASFRSFD
jgi:hypothetical protein